MLKENNNLIEELLFKARVMAVRGKNHFHKHDMLCFCTQDFEFCITFSNNFVCFMAQLDYKL